MEEQNDRINSPTTFYLGTRSGAVGDRLVDQFVAYESKHLVTHAVCVGMTGSGKTGLGITLLEEAAIDGIPSLVIDPKGDMTNLLLTFPDLLPSDFQQWMSADQAERQGQTIEEMAEQTAALWKKGIEQSHQSPERIRTLKNACEFNIYTPGSEAGLPISILSSFASPSDEVLKDGDLYRDRVSITATSLLTLLGIDADPIRSREHILLTTILDHCWQKRQSVDLGTLIQFVQTPPVKQVGVMDLESFFPSKDRFVLAMAMNNLLASPGFAAWMTGQPLDVGQLLYSPTGKPRVSILYTAHLSESERMFFTSLLLNETLNWMRSRPGTGSLRAIVYIDEIFGYLPPVREPPTKKPLLTLLKQARAYGVGLVLATQNPVDLDYKALSNAGTWFLGRLQTDQDKERMLDGLEGARNASGAGLDRATLSDQLSSLGKRFFLLHNVHAEKPEVFQTRWALSYLAGPLTRPQIKQLMDARRAEPSSSANEGVDQPLVVATEPSDEAPEDTQRPVLPPSVPQVFLPLRVAHGPTEIVYEPRLLAVGRVHFVNTRRNLAADEDVAMLLDLQPSPLGIDWHRAEHLALRADELTSEPPEPGRFLKVPPLAAEAKNYRSWQKSLADHLYRTRRFVLLKCKALDAISEPGETERDFRIRIADQAREVRDEKVEQLKKKYASKLATLEERLRKAELRVEREQQQASGVSLQTAINVGATILSMVLGRKKLSSTNVGRAATAARGVGRASEEAGDVERAKEDVAAYESKLSDLQDELESEVIELMHQFEAMHLEVEELPLKPRRVDIDLRLVALARRPTAERRMVKKWLFMVSPCSQAWHRLASVA